jgi:hypothetical protein
MPVRAYSGILISRSYSTDHQEGVGGRRRGLPEERRAPPNDRQVGLWLGTTVEGDRVLHRDDALGSHQPDERLGEVVHPAGVALADRAHRDHLPVDELHPTVFVQDPALAQTLIVVHGEWTTEQAVDGHAHNMDSAKKPGQC